MTIELAALSEAGAGFVVGLVAPDGAPYATRAWSADVLDEAMGRVRFLVSADDTDVFEALEGSSACLTGADVRTFRSVQWKGLVATVEPPTADDLALAEAHTARFFDAVHRTDGTPLELLDRIRPLEMMAVEMVVDEVYDQTPGPGAGAALDGRTR